MDLTAFHPFLEHLTQTKLAPWSEPLSDAVRERLGPRAHGDLARWEAALAALPELPPARAVLDQSCVGLHSDQPLPSEIASRLHATLMELHPWRKGPFRLHDLQIDTEWRSDWKWDRLADAIDPLDGRLVLDVGCGNGYHAWRMLGAGARLVMGIDPTQVFLCQFLAINRYLARDDLAVLPLGIEDLPPGLTGFDTVFSMGVLYHRRSPIDHLAELRGLLRPGGQLVLETLVTDQQRLSQCGSCSPSPQPLSREGRGAKMDQPSSSGDRVLDGGGQPVLVPPDRYAGMRNVWFIPSVEALAVWMGRVGFKDIEVVDVSRTTIEEQRPTDWMRFQSLPDHLDPTDPSRTIEGHPAPVRSILIGRA